MVALLALAYLVLKREQVVIDHPGVAKAVNREPPKDWIMGKPRKNPNRFLFEVVCAIATQGFFVL
jgi:hypothetical protein